MCSIDRGPGVEIDRTLAVSAFLQSFASVQRQNGQGVWGHSHKKTEFMFEMNQTVSNIVLCIFTSYDKITSAASDQKRRKNSRINRLQSDLEIAATLVVHRNGKSITDGLSVSREGPEGAHESSSSKCSCRDRP